MQSFYKQEDQINQNLLILPLLEFKNIPAYFFTMHLNKFSVYNIHSIKLMNVYFNNNKQSFYAMENT